MSLENLNYAWFALINASPDASIQTISFAAFMAGKVVYGVTLCILFAWVRKSGSFRFAILDVTFTVILSLFTSWIIGAVWYHPRPFVLGLGQKFIEHAPDSSFPSDHTTFMFAIALPLLAHSISRTWGIVVFILATVVAWSRVYLGIHFPFDIIGALIVALISTIAIRTVSSILHPNIYAPLCDFYERLISALHLPVKIFPRG